MPPHKHLYCATTVPLQGASEKETGHSSGQAWKDNWSFLYST